jgi:nitronate monooxygenase
MWKDRRFLDLAGVAHPILQAPMAGASTTALAIAVGKAGGLPSLACAMSSPEQARADIGVIRQQTSAPLNVNFFCHTPPSPDAGKEARWKSRLAPYYSELGLDPAAPVPAANRAPFDEAMCALMEETKPKIVSFHFGLPDAALLDRLRKAGCLIIASATTVAEA